MKRSSLLVGLLLATVRGGYAAMPTDPCTAAKIFATAKYSYCRGKADSLFVRSGDATKRAASYARCVAALAAAFGKAGLRYPGACPAPGDPGPVDAFVAIVTDETARGVGTGAGPTGEVFCGPGTAYDAGLAKCVAPTSTSTTTTTTASTTTTTTAAPTPVLDLTTGLMWEMKWNMDGVENIADPHDADNLYTWTLGTNGTEPTGTAFTLTFLATLNAPPCYAGYCDWRMPSREELFSLIDKVRLGCGGGDGWQYVPCSDPLVDPTVAENYWSFLSYFDTRAWVVRFRDGFQWTDLKTSAFHVRAVRSGT